MTFFEVDTLQGKLKAWQFLGGKTRRVTINYTQSIFKSDEIQHQHV